MKNENTIKLNMVKKVFKLLLKILYNIFIIFCILLILVVLIQRFTNSHGSVNGYRLFVVVSGSMIPKYNIGEVVICEEKPASELEVGDIIVYRGKYGDLNGKFIMHEVVDKRVDEKGEIKITAKGLLSGQEDPEVTEKQIMGIVKFKSEFLTFMYALAMNTDTFLIIIFILVLNVFISFKSTKHRQKIAKLEAQNEVEVEKEVSKYEQKVDDDEEKIKNITNNLAREIEELEKIEKSEENFSNDKMDE